MFRTALFAAGIALVLVSPALAANDLDPASLKALHDYSLSTAKVESFDKAYSALVSAGAGDPALAQEIKAMGAEQTKTVTDEVGKMTRHPKVYAFFEKQGLSKEDAVLLPLALTGGCMIAQHPEAAAQIPQASTEQAAFCKANLDKIKTLKLFGGKG